MEVFKDSKDLLIAIVHCKQCPNREIDCTEIFKYQAEHGISDLLPVPWQGRLETAKILFIGSNPSELNNGMLATKNWSDDKIVDFHEYRFAEREDNNPNKWSSGGTRYLLKSGKQSTKQVLYWRVLKNNWSPEIDKYYPLGRIIPGETYALTEIVHCYSKKDNILTQRCKVLCSDLFFKDILRFAKNAEIIAIMGKHATPIMNEYFKRHPEIKIDKELDWRPLVEQKKIGPGLIKVNLFGRDRLIIALPHPGAHQFLKQLKLYLTEDELKDFQDFGKQLR